MSDLPRCHRCGRFFKGRHAWKMVYSGGPIPTPDREIFRCARCLDVFGPFVPQAGIRPEFSCGERTGGKEETK